MKAYTQTAPLANNYDAVMEERTIAELKVVGEIPKELNGTLYRNGPNPQFHVPDAHWFSGDGMLHAFVLENGKATYRNRWIRTPKWLAERAAGHALFTGPGGSFPGPPKSAPDSGTANTNIICHAGRLLALQEQHLPMEIKPDTLDMLGYCDYDKSITGPFTAHPKIDPITGEMIFFGYSFGALFSATTTYGAISASGVVTRFEQFEAPYPSMIHDFIVTQNYVLFPILPLTGSLDRVKSGKPPYCWEPVKGSYIGLMRRDSTTKNIKWYRAEACYVFHVMNAWEEGNSLVANVMQSEQAPFPNADGTPQNHDRSDSRLCRWEFDLTAATDTFKRTYIDEIFGEFPRIDDRMAGLANLTGWIACQNPSYPVTGAYNGLASYEIKSGKRTTWYLPEWDGTSEPVFVPRSKDAAEGDGWLLTVFWRPNEGRSELAVFNASAIDQGPLATVELPFRVPYGFHGNWVDGK
jgi:carotenoid cleavage dioxygenase-like enzyme